MASITGARPAEARGPIVRHVPGMSLLLDVVCRPDGSCLAVGETPEEEGAVVVLRAAGPTGPIRTVPGTTRLSGLACHSGGSCMAVGQSEDGGVVVDVSLDGTPGVVRPAPGADELYEVACPTATTCVATGSVFNTQEPLHFFPTRLARFTLIVNGQPGPAQRYPRGLSPMGGVACPTATRCLIPSSDGIVVLTDTGSGWAVTATRFSGSLATGYPGGAISCPSPTACVATAGGFMPVDGGYLGVHAIVPVSANGTVGPVQLLDDESGSATDLSCVSGRTCTVVGHVNFPSQGLLVDVFRGTPTSSSRVAGSASLMGVSCVAVATCGIVGHTTTGALFLWHGPVPA